MILDEFFAVKPTHFKEVDLSLLPTRGIFYPTDFKLYIKKASELNIIEYETHLEVENPQSIIACVTQIVEECTFGSHSFETIKHNDAVHLFFQIVEFTKKTPIYMNIDGVKINVLKDFKHFDYSAYDYDEKSREIIKNGYRFSMPSIGVDHDTLNFILFADKNCPHYLDYNFLHLFLTGNKTALSFENSMKLLDIFESMDKYDIKEIEEGVEILNKGAIYSAYKDGKTYHIGKDTLDFSGIWK